MNTENPLKDQIEAHIHGLGLDQKNPSRLYKPMHYILSMKGKRIRPCLTLLAYHAVSEESPEKALDLACAVELFHNFTLMHDDIMDRAPVRRGQPTVHKVWDDDVAILSGDALFAFSIGLVGKGFQDKAEHLIAEFSSAAMLVCEGQMEDMDLAITEEVDIPMYLEMIRKKTAVLLGACMSLGAMAAGAEKETVNLFRQFGEDLGIGFQLQDDLMDAFPPEGFGKQVGGDIIENKKTFLFLKAYELASAEQKGRLDFWYGKSEESEDKVKEVLEIFKALDIQQKTLDLSNQYFEKARILARQLGETTNFEGLKEYLQFIAKRKL